MQRQSAKDPPRNNKKKDGSKEFFKNLGTVLTENSEKIRELVHNTIVVPPRNGKRGNRPKTTNGRAEEKPSTAGSSEKPVPEGSNKPAPEESSGPDRPTSPSRPRSQPSTGSSERPRAEETHKSSAKPADTGTASSGQPSAKEGSKPSSPDSHTFYFDDGDAVDPEQYFENDVDPEQYFDDDIDLDWSAATAHIDDYDVPPTSSTTLPDNDETTPLAGKYEDKEFCDKYDEVDYDHKHEDVDQDWLAATSCIPDVDVPPECAEEDVEDVWVDGEGEKGSDAYNDVAAEEGDIQKNVLSDEELAADQVFTTTSLKPYPSHT